ncbi:MAG: HD-GYP domain-containing protein [Lachnospiraceae bacterium]|nr:HD-GYP domain-containing protein [Lachnospiraceae bacterium]
MEKIKKREKKRGLRFLQMIIMCIIGISINILGSFLAQTFSWKIYLDTVGTVLTAVFGGYIPGVITGISTNIFTGFLIDGTSFFYGSLNVLIALVSAYFARRHFLKKPLGILAFILALAAIGGVLGSAISWCINGDLKDEVGNHDLFSAGHWREFFQSIYANLYIDILDKAITVLIAAIPYNLLPTELRRNLRYRGWQQRALSREEKDEMMKLETRRTSLRTKVVLLLVVFSFVISGFATIVSVSLYRKNSVEEKKRFAKETASLAAAAVGPDIIDDILILKRSANGYAKTEELLYEIKKTSPDIEYVYVYQIQKDGCHVIFDLDTEAVEASEPGEVLAFEGAFEEYLPALLAGEEIEPIISDDMFGWLLTAYQPIYDKYDKCVAYACVDISMKQLTANYIIFMTKMISLYLGFLLLALVFGWWFAEYSITIPVNTMARSAGSFAFNNGEGLDESVEGLKNLEIHTGDEIENLYNALVKMSTDSVNYVEELEAKNETISKMQMALIMVLADMVEGRDEDTGDHIRKTAAYTRIIMNGLRKKGYYTDQITDQFMYDVFHSAPLHDVGKIGVSDLILNKPGKLTDEEFEEMKKHTLIGEEIMNKVIEAVPNSGYLTEARNLAGGHHEKWNGKGYPRGLAGEEIPLSARIMAVADVFDALISKRVYKPPFTIEKALSIIKEDAGSHFDPLVAEAFLAEEEEVRKVAEAFGNDMGKLLREQVE